MLNRMLALLTNPGLWLTLGASLVGAGALAFFSGKAMAGEWKQAGRSVRGGEVGYTALIGQDYTREDGTAASGYYVGKKFDVSQTRGRQPDRAPVYAADELVTAVFTNSSPVAAS